MPHIFLDVILQPHKEEYDGTAVALPDYESETEFLDAGGPMKAVILIIYLTHKCTWSNYKSVPSTAFHSYHQSQIALKIMLIHSN